MKETWPKDISELKSFIAREARSAFSGVHAPRYSFSLNDTVETLSKVLLHKLEDRELDGVGQQILDGIATFHSEQKIGNLPDRVEPYAKFVLKLIDPQKYESLRLSKGVKFTMPCVLGPEGLGLATEEILRAPSLESLCGMPRFAEHVARAILARNEVHRAPEWSLRERAQLFESITVVLLLIVAEHRQAIELAIIASANREHLRYLCRQFAKWQVRYVEAEGVEQHVAEFEGIDPLAFELVAPVSSDRHDGKACQSRGNESDEDEQPEPQEARRGRVLNLIEQTPRIVLLGDPGSGKTTTLQFLAWRTAKDLLEKSANASYYPIYLPLNICTAEPGKSLIEQIETRLAHADHFIRDLACGRFMLLLDGLNEVRPDYLTTLARDLRDLMTRYGQARVVVTSRPGIYKRQLECPVFMLLPFSDQQVHELLVKYFVNEQKALALEDALHRQPKLHEWARNPLMLTMVAVVGAVETTMTANRGQLLRCFMRAMFKREQLQNEKQTDEYTKTRALSRLAYATRLDAQVQFSRDSAIRILKQYFDDTSRHIDPVDFLIEVINNRIIVEAVETNVTFAHELYQEYFAAEELAVELERDQRLLLELAKQPAWQEPIILYSGLTKDYIDVAQRLSYANPHLAALALTTASHYDAHVATSIAQRAEAIFSKHSEPRVDCLRALITLGDYVTLLKLLPRARALRWEYVGLLMESVRAANASQVIEILSYVQKHDARRLEHVISHLRGRQLLCSDKHERTVIATLVKSLRGRRNAMSKAILIDVFNCYDAFAGTEVVTKLLASTKIDARAGCQLAYEIVSRREELHTREMVDRLDAALLRNNLPELLLEREGWHEVPPEAAMEVALAIVRHRTVNREQGRVGGVEDTKREHRSVDCLTANAATCMVGSLSNGALTKLASWERLPVKWAKHMVPALLARDQVESVMRLTERFGDKVAPTVLELHDVIETLSTENLVKLASWERLSAESAKHMVSALLTRDQVESVIGLIERFGDEVTPTVLELHDVIETLGTENLVKLADWERLPAELAKHMVSALLTRDQVESVMRLTERFGDVVSPTVLELHDVIETLGTESLVKLASWERLRREWAQHMVPALLVVPALLARGQVESVIRLIERFGDVVRPTAQQLSSAIMMLNNDNLVKLASWEQLPAESAKHMVSALLARDQVESVMRLMERFGDEVCPTVQELSGAIKMLDKESLVRLTSWERLPVKWAKHMVPALLARDQVESVMRLIERFGDEVSPTAQELRSAIKIPGYRHPDTVSKKRSCQTGAP